jgi:Zn-dependent protease/predicted transcriptional regulator
MHGVRLGKVLGFEISIDWSWLLIFFLVVFTLSSGYFPSLRQNFGVTTNWMLGVAAALLLFASVLVHELSHSVVARRNGIEVKGITLFIFGGVSQTADEPQSATEEFWMSIVGPVTSFALAVFFGVLEFIGINSHWPGAVVALVGYLAMINFFLGVFNLVPGFPLDGGRVLRSIIWGASGNLTKATRWASYSGQAFGYLLMAVGFFNMVALGAMIGGLWLIFIGWFLTGAARSSYEQLMVRQALSGVPVEKVMTTDVPEIAAEMTVRQFVDEQLLRHEYACYPVMKRDDVIGVVGAEEVRTVRSEMWDFTPVEEIVHRIDGAFEIDANDDAWEALGKLASPDVCRLMVMEDGHLKGTLGREAIYRLISTKARLGV